MHKRVGYYKNTEALVSDILTFVVLNRDILTQYGSLQEFGSCEERDKSKYMQAPVPECTGSATKHIY